MARIQRVMPLLLKEEKNKNDYIPRVVSIGPYHHGKLELAPVEAFKPLAVDLFISGGPQSMDFYYSQLLGIIGEIRQCYEEESTVDYSDNQLARLMLQDACFIIVRMEISASDTARLKRLTMRKHLGLLTATMVLRDLFLLENQIPLRVIKLLINLRYEAGEYENLLHRYLNSVIFGEYRRNGESENERAEPLHLLEAFHRLLISNCGEQPHPQPRTQSGGAAPKITNPACHSSTRSRRWLCCPRSKYFDIESGDGPKRNPKLDIKKKKVIHSFRSVTDLKAKGIFFEPSLTKSLKDVDFKSHLLTATVQLPYWYVSIYTKVFFLNMIAYELSPNNFNEAEVTSYINFMKSLMERAEDVKELREKKILYNQLGSDEEVLCVYKDMNTYGDNPVVFGELKDKIQAHYSSKTKTWIAELIHTYFRTPWTVIAFLGALSLLAISAAQLQYAVHPTLIAN